MRMKDIIINTLAGIFCTACTNAQTKLTPEPLENATRFECKYFDEEYVLTKEHINYKRKGSSFFKSKNEKYKLSADCYDYFMRRMKESNVHYDPNGEKLGDDDFYRFTLNAYNGKKLIFSAEGNHKNEGTCKYDGAMPPHFFDAVVEYSSNKDVRQAPVGTVEEYEYSSGAWEYPEPSEKYIVKKDGKGCKVTVIDYHYDIHKEKTFNCSSTLLDEISNVVLDHLMYKYLSSYQPEERILDGDHWSLDIKYKDSHISSHGSNASYADNGTNIIHALIRKAVGIEKK